MEDSSKQYRGKYLSQVEQQGRFKHLAHSVDEVVHGG